MDKKQLKELLSLHKKWLHNEPGGKRADLPHNSSTVVCSTCAMSSAMYSRGIARPVA